MLKLIGFVIYFLIIQPVTVLKPTNLTIRIKLNFIKQKLPSANRICHTTACNEIAKDILEHMNLTANPCEDFFEFSCGKFLSNDEIPPLYDEFYSFKYALDKLERNTQSILTEPLQSTDLFYEKEVKMFFHSCTNITGINADGKSFIRNMLEEFDGWPMLKGNAWNEQRVDLTDILKRLHVFGVQGLFKITVEKYIGYDDAMIAISQPDITLSSNYYDSNTTKRIFLEILEEYMTNVGIYFGGVKSRIIKSITDLKDLYAEIAECNRFHHLNQDAFQRTITLADFKAKFDNFNFGFLIMSLFNETGIVIKSREILVNEHPRYINCLELIQRRTPKRTIVDYLMWKFVESMRSVYPYELQSSRDEFLYVIDKYPEFTTRWEMCYSLLSERLEEPFSAFYVRRFFKKLAKKKVLDMVRGIKRSYQKLLSETTWLDSQTKSKAVRKLSYMRDYIGYASRFDDPNLFRQMFEKESFAGNFGRNLLISSRIKMKEHLKVYRENFTHRKPTVLIVGASYTSYGNYQEVPAGILVSPLYSDEYPMFINFGAIGFIIGHEITHGFDNFGRQFNAEGKLGNWWKDSDDRSYRLKSNCLLDQYNKFVVDRNNNKVDGNLTLNENIADNGGIRIAFNAYKDWLIINGAEPNLPGLNFTSHQMFFIAFAKTICGKTTSEGLLERIRTGPHSPVRYRVLGSLMNLKEFSEAFNCPKESPMNPIAKCRVW